jgi:hypothetical protein
VVGGAQQVLEGQVGGVRGASDAGSVVGCTSVVWCRLTVGCVLRCMVCGCMWCWEWATRCIGVLQVECCVKPPRPARSPYRLGLAACMAPNAVLPLRPTSNTPSNRRSDGRRWVEAQHLLHVPAAARCHVPAARLTIGLTS